MSDGVRPTGVYLVEAGQTSEGVRPEGVFLESGPGVDTPLAVTFADIPPETFIDFVSIATPTAPVALATAVAGNPNGTYEYVVTYKGTTYETAWSAASNTVTPASKQVTVTIPISTSSLVTQRKLYRTKDGAAGTYYLLATIDNNTETTYTDNTADGSLGDEIPHGLINAAFTTGGLKIDGHYLLRDSGHELAIGRSAGGTPSIRSYDNVYIGENAGQSIENGAYNTIIGNQAAPVMTNAGNFVVNNTIIGTKAGNDMTNANYNTCVGADAGHQVTHADYNTLIGDEAGNGDHPLTTGEHNTFLGYKAGLGSSTQRDYLTVIGAGAEGDEDNAIVLGRAADTVHIPGDLRVDGQDVTIYTYLAGTIAVKIENGPGSAGPEIYARNTLGGTYVPLYIDGNPIILNGAAVPAGLVGIGVTPTARLHLPASAAAANSASLKIDPGTVASAPVSGNIESDGTHLYWTDSGGTRRQLDN